MVGVKQKRNKKVVKKQKEFVDGWIDMGKRSLVMNKDTLLNNAREIIKALRAKWIADDTARADCAPEPIWQHYAGTAMRPDLYSCEAQYALADCMDAGLWREII